MEDGEGSKRLNGGKLLGLSCIVQLFRAQCSENDLFSMRTTTMSKVSLWRKIIVGSGPVR